MLRILYPQEVSENEQLNLLLPREETRETNPPGHWLLPPPLSHLRCQVSSPAAGKERCPNSLGAAVPAPSPDPALDSAQQCTRASGTLWGDKVLKHHQ